VGETEASQGETTQAHSLPCVKEERRGLADGIAHRSRPDWYTMRASTWALLPFLLLVPWSLWAIAVDDTPTEVSDSIALRSSIFAERLFDDPAVSLEMLLQPDKIPPLPIAAAGLVLLVVGGSLFALRLGGVICYALLLWQCQDLARSAGAGPRTAAWAALLCGVTPLVYGWTRLEYSDIYLAPIYLGCLQVMLRGPLTRRRALALGLLGGLGMLCKLSFLVLVLPPLAYLVWSHLRQPGQRLNLALGAGLALLVGGWWLLWHGDIVLQNFQHSTQAWRGFSTRFGAGGRGYKIFQLGEYFWAHHGLPSLWLAALAGLVLGRGVFPRPARVLLALGSLGGLVLMLLFDPGLRYLTPLAPAAAVLGALALDAVLRRLPRLRLPAEAALALLLLGLFVWLNVTPSRSRQFRHDTLGMLTPISSFTEACRAIRHKPRITAVVYRNELLHEWLAGVFGAVGFECRFPDPTPVDRLADSAKPCAILVQPETGEPDNQPELSLIRRCPDMRPLHRFGRQAALRFFLMRPDEVQPFMGLEPPPPHDAPRTGRRPR
jgi:hypothetical protein